MSTKEQQPILTGGKTADEIDKLKKQHGRLTLVSTEDADGNPLHFWFHRPDMKVMGAFTKIGQQDPVQANLLLFRACLLNQENVKYADDVDVMFAIIPHLEAMIDRRSTEVKNF